MFQMLWVMGSALLFQQQELVRCNLVYEGDPPIAETASVQCPDDHEEAESLQQAAETVLANRNVRAPHYPNGVRSSLFMSRVEGEWVARRWAETMMEPALPLALRQGDLSAVCQVEATAIPDGRITQPDATCRTNVDASDPEGSIGALFELAAEAGFAQWVYSRDTRFTTESICFQFQVSGGVTSDAVESPPC